MTLIEKAAKRFREKGFFALLAAVLGKIFFSFSFVRMMKHRYIMGWLRKNYGYVIQKYKNFQCPPPQYAE